MKDRQQQKSTELRNWKIKQALLVVIVISLMIIGSSGCSTAPKIITVPVTLPVPMQPIRPDYTEEEKYSMSDAAWKKTVIRDRLCTDYADDAIAIIKGNNKRVKEQP